MEDFVLEFWARETAPVLTGLFIREVYVDSQGRVLLRFDGRPGGYLLLRLKPGAVYACAGLGSAPVRLEQPLSTPSTTALAAQLTGRSVRSLDKLQNDRIVRINVASGDVQCTWIIEMIPLLPNALLLDSTGQVISLLYPDRHRRRGLSVGVAYQPPLRADADRTCTHHQGIEPVLTQQLSPCIYSATPSEHRDWRHFNPWRELVVSPIQLVSRQADSRTDFKTLNQAMHQFIEMVEESECFMALFRATRKRLRTTVAAKGRAVAAALRDSERMAKPDYYRRCGEMLLANLEEVKAQLRTADRAAAQAAIQAKDYYQAEAPQTTIPVDPRKTVQANAENYFKAYRKAQRGRQIQADRLVDNRRQLACALRRLEDLESVSELQGLQRLLGGQDPSTSAARRQRPKKQAPRQAGRKQYRSSDGYDIVVARSAAQNDELTFRDARPYDLWLHVADYTGAHVLVRNPRRSEIPRTTIIEAAQLAAYYSNAKAESRVDVRFTEQRHVQRVKGAAKGLVRLRQYKTICVSPQRTTPNSAQS